MCLTKLGVNHPHGHPTRWVDTGEILLADNIILFHGKPRILEKVTQNTLEVDYNHRSVHLVHSSSEKVAECPLVKLRGRR